MLALSAAVLWLALLASCTTGSEAPISIYGNPSAVEQYGDILLPGLAADQELDQLDAEQYRSLVRSFREGGLEALSDDDRRELVLVARVAFLSYAETARYDATSRDASPGTVPSNEGKATVEEMYVRRSFSSTQSTVSRLAARRVTSDGIGWLGGLTPYWDAESRGEWWLFVDFLPGEQDSEVDTAIVTQWAQVDGEWMCYRSAPTSSYEYYAAELDYWGTFVRLARAILAGRDTLDGQPVYRFEDYQDRSVEYWLDAETLWLRQYRYQESSGAVITVKLEAVNEDITIEPPNVDVPCVEESPE